MTNPPIALALHNVRFGYPDQSVFLGPVTLELRAGDALAVVGPNGAGKSTLLRLMAGLLRPVEGAVLLEDRPIEQWSVRARACRVAVLTQHPPHDLPVTARDVVLMGRFPHRALGLFDSPEDLRVAEREMAATDTLEFADRPLSTLSGGEAQRVHLAAALAQTPRVLLLDEPTASLDLRHQYMTLRLLRKRVNEQGLAMVFITHDANLAATFASHVLVLHAGRVAAHGTPADVVVPDVLEPVYGVRMLTLSSPERPGHRWVVPVEERADMRP